MLKFPTTLFFFEFYENISPRKKYNTQTKRQVYLTLKHKGLDVIPSVHPSELFAYTNGIPGGDSLYPLGGISGKIPSIVMKMENTPFLKAIVMVLIIQI